MRYKFWQTCAIAGVAAFTLLGAASPASALSSDTTGSLVYGDDNEIAVWDTKCDGDPAYARWIQQGGSDVYRFNNKSGCKTKAGADVVTPVVSIQACRDTTLARDNCGGWNEW